MLGDVNGDGSINALDALDTLKHAANLSVLSDTTSADVNKDGKVDANDALMILQYVAKIIDRFE